MSWQVIPKRLEELSGDYSTAANKRAMTAMLKMGKIDIAALERAYEGNDGATRIVAVSSDLPGGQGRIWDRRHPMSRRLVASGASNSLAARDASIIIGTWTAIVGNAAEHVSRLEREHFRASSGDVGRGRAHRVVPRFREPSRRHTRAPGHAARARVIGQDVHRRRCARRRRPGRDRPAGMP